MDDTQLHLAIIPREVRVDRGEANWPSGSLPNPGKADQPPVLVALRSRTERYQAYTAELMPVSTPQPKDGRMDEELKREMNAPRKPAKVSVWKVEGEKL
jgi:hypothetical protein